MQVKELSTAFENFARSNQQELTKAQNEQAQGSITGKKVLMRDYQLLKQHKDLLKEFVYMEMREHARQLEMYAKMFEEVSQKVNIEREFTLTMMTEKRFTD